MSAVDLCSKPGGSEQQHAPGELGLALQPAYAGEGDGGLRAPPCLNDASLKLRLPARKQASRIWRRSAAGHRGRSATLTEGSIGWPNSAVSRSSSSSTWGSHGAARAEQGARGL